MMQSYEKSLKNRKNHALLIVFARHYENILNFFSKIVQLIKLFSSKFCESVIIFIIFAHVKCSVPTNRIRCGSGY